MFNNNKFHGRLYRHIIISLLQIGDCIVIVRNETFDITDDKNINTDNEKYIMMLLSLLTR